MVTDDDTTTVYFDNDYKITFFQKTDCCAEIYLYNINEVFKEGKFIGHIKISWQDKSTWLRTYDQYNEETGCEAFYSTNNGWYAPYCNIRVFNRDNKLIFEERIEDYDE